VQRGPPGKELKEVQSNSLFPLLLNIACTIHNPMHNTVLPTLTGPPNLATKKEKQYV
jgi:hypothetical protein